MPVRTVCARRNVAAPEDQEPWIEWLPLRSVGLGRPRDFGPVGVEESVDLVHQLAVAPAFVRRGCLLVRRSGGTGEHDPAELTHRMPLGIPASQASAGSQGTLRDS